MFSDQNDTGNHSACGNYGNLPHIISQKLDISEGTNYSFNEYPQVDEQFGAIFMKISGLLYFFNPLQFEFLPLILSYITSKYNTIQYNTIQYNTIQYNTIHTYIRTYTHTHIHTKCL